MSVDSKKKNEKANTVFTCSIYIFKNYLGHSSTQIFITTFSDKCSRERERGRGERQTDRQTGRQAGRQADRQTGRQRQRQRDRDRETGRQTDRQRDWQEQLWNQDERKESLEPCRRHTSADGAPITTADTHHTVLNAFTGYDGAWTIPLTPWPIRPLHVSGQELVKTANGIQTSIKMRCGLHGRLQNRNLGTRGPQNCKNLDRSTLVGQNSRVLALEGWAKHDRTSSALGWVVVTCYMSYSVLSLRRRLWSFLLYLCYVFRALINSLVCRVYKSPSGETRWSPCSLCQR